MSSFTTGSISDVDRTCEANAVLIIKRDLRRVRYIQLHEDSEHERKSLSDEKEKLECLSSKLHFTKQQIEFFTHEIQRAEEGLKDANWQFTKELCTELGKIKNPTPTLLDIVDKFMLMLDQKDRSWKTFKAITKNYGPLKSLMNGVATELVSQEKMNDLLPVCRNFHEIHTKLQKISRGASLIAEWISYSVEYKLKKETLYDSKKRLLELERRIKQKLAIIAELNAKILTLEETIADKKLCLEAAKREPTEDHSSVSDISVISLKSLSYSFKAERVISVTPIRRGTASGGLLSSPRTFAQVEVIDEPILTPRFVPQQQEFPDFKLGSEELYGEAPVSKKKEEEFEIKYEGANELLGCCRSKFFCF